MGQVVDTETAKEFMKETLEKVDAAELAKICTEVEAKSEWFHSTLGEESFDRFSRQDYSALLGRIFSARGKTRKTLEAYDFEVVRDRMGELIHGSGPVDERFQGFVDQLEGLPQNLRVDFASELLHFTYPERHWLWTRWMWDTRTRTGSLPLVTTASYDLQGESAGEVYMKVGRALAFVHENGSAAGFGKIGRSVFGTDVFLSCVYVIYVYTVLKMRMTQEFNQVMPGLPEFSRRLLGVHQKGSRPAAA
jgi:hypothetical protein